MRNCEVEGRKEGVFFFLQIKNRKDLWRQLLNTEGAFTEAACDIIHAATTGLQGRSDHNLVQLSPSYKPVVQQQPVRSVRKWSPEGMESLQGVLEG